MSNRRSRTETERRGFRGKSEGNVFEQEVDHRAATRTDRSRRRIGGIRSYSIIRRGIRAYYCSEIRRFGTDWPTVLTLLKH